MVKGTKYHAHTETCHRKYINNITANLSRQSQLSESLPKRKKLGIIKCPHCNLMVKIAKLHSHINKVHISSKNNKLVQNVSPTKPSNSILIKNEGILVRCPHCNANVRNSRIHNHILKVHKQKIINQNETLKEPAKCSIGGIFTHTEKKIDGSKGWQTFREGGRFGSHPGFDPMDDESFPD